MSGAPSSDPLVRLAQDEAATNTRPDEPIVGHIANYGFMRLNWEGPARPTDRTLIITGVEPGDGAAIIGNAMRQMGVPVFFFPAGASLRGEGLSGFNFATGFGEHARKLTDQYGTWGARVPFRRAMVSAARRAVKDPHMIVVMEDAATIALGNEHGADGGVASALASAAERIADLTLYASELTLPTMILSIQKAREFAAQSIDALAMFAGVSPQPEARLAAIALIDQGARTLSPVVIGARATQGALDRVQKAGRVAGWAKLPLSKDRVRVRATIDGVDVGESVADQLRQDLVKHKIGDGHHGFTIDLKRVLTTADIKTVQVYSAEDNALIGTVAMNNQGGRVVS